MQSIFQLFVKFLTFNYVEALELTYTKYLNNSSFSFKFRGILNYHLQKYQASLINFQEFRELFPYNLDTIDYYSSCLWHLKKHKQLAYLSRICKDINSHSPLTWICIGNLMSLEKNKNFAIESLKRAVELNIPAGIFPDMKSASGSISNRFVGKTGNLDLYRTLSYSLCLLGHELFDNEDLEGALKCYTHAILANSNSYQAYYGIGTIYIQREEFALAEKYFKYAIVLNPKSAMVYCNLAQAQTNLGKFSIAANTLKKACKIDPINNQYKFYLAKSLEKLGDYKSALFFAEQVKIAASKEPSIYELLARIYLKLGKKTMAITCANLAVSYGKGICDNNQNSSVNNSTLNQTGNQSADDMNNSEEIEQTPHRVASAGNLRAG